MPDTETDPRRESALFRYRVIAEALSLPAGSPERRQWHLPSAWSLRSGGLGA